MDHNNHKTSNHRIFISRNLLAISVEERDIKQITVISNSLLTTIIIRRKLISKVRKCGAAIVRLIPTLTNHAGDNKTTMMVEILAE